LEEEEKSSNPLPKGEGKASIKKDDL